MNTPFLGAILDPRPIVEKAQDWQHSEVAQASAPIVFPEKPVGSVFFSTRNQAQSGSCMAQSGVKALGIENAKVRVVPYIDLSALPVYRARSNFPASGMFQKDLFSLLTKPFACKESDLPSQGMSDGQMNNFSGALSDSENADATLFKSDSYVFMATGDINEMAAQISQGKAVHLMFFFKGEEWWKPVPTIVDASLANGADALRHGVVAVDFLMNNGERCLVIEDSAGNEYSINGKGQRIITETFLKARCFGAGYVIKNPIVPATKPQYRFTKSLAFGLMADADVVALQKILKFEGFFPAGIDFTGNMLQITCAALLKWQISHGITDFTNVADIRLVRFGPKSIAVANSLYA